ncbi:MAG: glycosyltransferase [Planctomycetota bacterium]
MNIVTLSNLYPSSARRNHGVFVEERMTRYAEKYSCHLRVVAPVPWFPFRSGFGEYSQFAATPKREVRRGIDIYHPRVITIPKVGASCAPFAWTQACSPLIQKLRGQRAIDVLDAHYLYPDGVAAVRIARKLQIPVVLSARGSDVNVIAQIPKLRKKIVEACAAAPAVVAVSAALSKSLQQIGVPADKIYIIRNGVDVDMFRPAAARAAKNITEGRVLFGVGRLVQSKGWHLAIEALAKLLPAFPDLQLVIAGGGPDLGEFVELSKRLRVHERVRFLGDVAHANIPELLWSAHRFVFPSFREGHPNAVVEAVAAGVPVVATPVGGIPEIVDSRFGELSTGVDAASFTKALERSLNKNYSSGDFEAQRELLRWDSSLAALDEVFQKAVAAGPPK